MVKHYLDANNIYSVPANPILYAERYKIQQTYTLCHVYWDRECTQQVSEDDAYKMFMNGNMFCTRVDIDNEENIFELDCTSNSRGGFISGGNDHVLFYFES